MVVFYFSWLQNIISRNPIAMMNAMRMEGNENVWYKWYEEKGAAEEGKNARLTIMN